MTADLFDSVGDVRSAEERMAEGAVLLRGFARPREGELIAALRENRISVTPLRIDMTDEAFMTRLAELFE